MRRSTKALVCVFSLVAIAGCAGTSAAPPVAATTTQSQAQLPVQDVRAAERFGLSRSMLVQQMARRGPGYIAPSLVGSPTLFLSDLGTQTIELYPANAKDPSPSGSITQGIDQPINVAVDKNGTLYVANNGNSTVTEYPLGQTKPSVTLTDSLVYPNGIAVDSHGTVYVTSGATVGACYVLEFRKGKTKPSRQVNGFGLPIGLAVDKDGNLYVGDAQYRNYKVWEVPKGSTTPVNLGLSGLADPTGVAIDPANNLYVSNDSPSGGNDVLGYVLGQTTPFVTITAGMNGPYSLAFERNGYLFVGNSLTFPGSVSGFKKGKTTPFETFTNGVNDPAGIAAYPPPRV